MGELKMFSIEVMALVGRTGVSAHDLLRMARRGRMLDWAGESQYYVEPKRLARLGYLDARTEPGRTRERTVYTLTDKGLEALREYAASPVRFEPVKSDLLLRVLLADLVGEEVVRETVGTLRSEIDDLRERLAASEEAASALPHRSKYLLMNCGFLRQLLDLHEKWVEAIERELAPAPRGPVARGDESGH